MTKAIQRGLVAASVLVMAGAANAAIDVTGAVTKIEEAGTAVATVGLATFLVVVGIKVWGWLKRV